VAVQSHLFLGFGKGFGGFIPTHLLLQAFFILFLHKVALLAPLDPHFLIASALQLQGLTIIFAILVHFALHLFKYLFRQ
jgi:membrane protein implicated in regulation of membrane protease activity